ncbi:hypothetical protein [Streptomyces broussonetiae]|uniref:Uncharacterized protein n=1 Tax=Streptomyces broussonetiae TaxID=2686304 RepID=A0ABV5EEB7_9ACTN
MDPRTAGNRTAADAGLSRPEPIRPSDVDWTAFRAEHPWMPGTAEDWLNRLRRALVSAVRD